MFEIIYNGQVLKVTVTEKNAAKPLTIEKTHFCMSRRIKIDAEKTAISIGVNLRLNFTWQEFDIKTGEFVVDTSAVDPIFVEINGVKEELFPANGFDYIDFSSNEHGVYIVKTVTPGVDNSTLEVTASA